MKTREQIMKELVERVNTTDSLEGIVAYVQQTQLEVLLDIRDLLTKENK